MSRIRQRLCRTSRKWGGKPYTALHTKASSNYDAAWDKACLTVNEGTRYPRDVVKCKHDKEKLHPTQKPVELLEMLIKTYTSEGEVVLDNCMGAGSTCVACVNTNRKYIGIEQEPKYFAVACERIQGAENESLCSQ